MTNEPDQFGTTILIDMPGILTPAALAYAIDEVKKFSCPLPQLTKAILPCDLLITSKEDENGEDVGRIQFKRIDGTVIFDEKWVIRKSS
jgi:hypothetical protein